jgi:hypothetical protein
MTPRRELVLKKLHALPETEVVEAIRVLTLHVKARLRFGSLIDRTKSGAHGPKNLGMEAIDFYVGESIKRLYDPDGWDWKFEQFTLSQQLCRIANKLISDKVTDYKNKLPNAPQFEGSDISDNYTLCDPSSEDYKDHEQQATKVIEYAIKVSADDENLQYFVMRYFEGADYNVIGKEMSLTLEHVYALRKKLVRRLMSYKQELSL